MNAALSACCILRIGLILWNLRISIQRQGQNVWIWENQSCPLCNFSLGVSVVPEECVHAGIAVEQAGAERQMALWNEPGLGLHCSGRNKEPLGVFWPGNVHWASLICVALMPASFYGLPQDKRCNMVCLAFSSVKTLIFICLHIHVFPPL